jgi:uncharacterized damage-inducible protein DinB
MSRTEPLREALRQLACVIEGLEDEPYRRSPAGAGGGIGAHVRHCLDLVEALLAAAGDGHLDYDRRQRGSAVERERAAALRDIDRLDAALGRLPEAAMASRIVVSSLLSPEGPPARMESTLGRELAYVISHTTHHNALIGWLVRAFGAEVPLRFGYAAATLAWMEETRCAP